jgi:hypothetical protein
MGSSSAAQVVDSGTDIAALYIELTNALTEVLAENSVGPARRGRRARALAATADRVSRRER